MSEIMKYQSTMLCGELSGGYSTKTPCIGKDDSIPEWLRKNVEKAIIDGIVEDEKTYTTDVLPTTEPLKAIEVSVLCQGTKETKWIDCTYNTNILLSFPTQVHGYFSYKGDKINIKRVLKWKYR